MWIVSESREDLVREMAAGSESMPAVRHYQQKEFSGMFEYSKDDELIVVKKLILGWYSGLLFTLSADAYCTDARVYDSKVCDKWPEIGCRIKRY